jgi:ABC-type transport system involved in cytochrome c biogenesis permease subunit
METPSPAWIAAFEAVLNKVPVEDRVRLHALVLFMGCSSYLLHKEGASVLVESGGEGRFLGITLSLLHGIPALVSVVTMALAFVVSAVFLVVERRLKERKVGVLSIAGPNLQFLDRLNGRLVQVAFLAISLVVLSGGVWSVSEQKPVFSFDTSVMSGLALWVLLAVILYARMVLGWSPKRVSRLTVLVTATFFATILVVMVVAGRLTHAELWS